MRAALTRAEIRITDQDAQFLGWASITERPYVMWDWAGEYTEVITAGAFAVTLAASPLVEMVINHGRGGQLPVAHTRNQTLRLSEDETGLRTEADLDLGRTDVADMVRAIKRGDLAEMSFRFAIEESRWSPDYTEFRIDRVDLDRGDVSPVNFGANPYTMITQPSLTTSAPLDVAALAKQAFGRRALITDSDTAHRRPLGR